MHWECFSVPLCENIRFRLALIIYPSTHTRMHIHTVTMCKIPYYLASAMEHIQTHTHTDTGTGTITCWASVGHMSLPSCLTQNTSVAHAFTPDLFSPSVRTHSSTSTFTAQRIPQHITGRHQKVGSAVSVETNRGKIHNVKVKLSVSAVWLIQFALCCYQWAPGKPLKSKATLPEPWSCFRSAVWRCKKKH